MNAAAAGHTQVITQAFPDLVGQPTPIQVHLDVLARPKQFPAVALRACVARSSEAAPHLRSAIEAVANGDRLPEAVENLAFWAIHILGAARDQTPFPTLLRLARLPEERLEQLFGDALTTSLSRIAAGMFNGDVDALLGLAADPNVDEYVRSGFFTAAAFLTWEGRIEREVMRAFVRRFNQEALAIPRDYGWVAWAEAIAALGWRDMAADAETAFDDGRIDPIGFSAEEFRKLLTEAELKPDDYSRLKRGYMGYIDDVVEELNWCRPLFDNLGPFTAGDQLPPSVGEPASNPYRHIGRNDPCPCGSGKKAKKCCLN